MSVCAKCECWVEPAHEMQADGRIVPVCPRCSSVVVEETKQPEPPRETPKAPATNESILALAKKRLDVVRSLLLDVSVLQNEAAMLERMIAAAESK